MNLTGAATSSGLRLELLGTPCLVWQSGRTLSLQRKDAALLALLALDGPQPPGRITALLWPDAEGAQARGNLRQRLFRLRRAAATDVVESSGELLGLSRGIDAALPEPRSIIAVDPDACSQPILGSLDFFEEEELDQWVGHARGAWRRRVADALAAEAADLESNSRWFEAVRLAERIVADDPWLEHGYRRLMRLHYLRGDRAAGLAAFARCRERLQRDLNVTPDVETRSLAALIETADAARERLAAPISATARRPPRLVGREAALRSLALARQTHRCVIVEGEAGSGKSRLLETLVGLREERTVVSTGARPGDAQIAYSLLARAVALLVELHGEPEPAWVRGELARISPRFGAPPAEAMSLLRFRQAIEAAFGQWQGAGTRTFVIDDLHFADASSVDMLLSLAAAPAAERAWWVLAVRPGEEPAAVNEWLARSREDDVTRLQLSPLDEAETRSLLESLQLERLDVVGCAAPLARHCRGNPQLILETVRALLSDPSFAGTPDAAMPVTPSMQQMIDARLRRLSPQALQLVRLAASAGQDFDDELAAAALERRGLEVAEATTEAEANWLLCDGRFEHDLFAEATRASTPPAVARHLHARIAAALQARGGEPARIAMHWRGAQCWDRAGTAFVHAATAAGRVSDRRLEAALAADAAGCHDKAGQAREAFVARERELRAGYFIDSFSVQLRRAERLVQDATHPVERATALELKARTLIDDIHDDVHIAAVASEARTIAETLGDRQRAFMAARLEARAHARSLHRDEASRLIAIHLPEALACADPRTRAVALGDYGCALMSLGRVDEAEALFAQALEVARTEQDWGTCQDLHLHTAWVHNHRGDVALTIRSYEAGRALAPMLGAAARPANIAEAILGRLYLQSGDFDRGLALLERTAEEQRNSPTYGLTTATLANLSIGQLWLGQPMLAARTLGRITMESPGMSRRVALFAKAQIEIRQGRPALRLLEAARAEADQEGSPYGQLIVDAALARELVPEQGALLALDAIERSVAAGLDRATWSLRLAACDALRRAGQRDAAATAAREIAARFASGAPPGDGYPPEYGWIAHLALLDVGDDIAARACLDGAARWIADALPRVSTALRHNFVDDNKVNASVRAAAIASSNRL